MENQPLDYAKAKQDANVRLSGLLNKLFGNILLIVWSRPNVRFASISRVGANVRNDFRYCKCAIRAYVVSMHMLTIL